LGAVSVGGGTCVAGGGMKVVVAGGGRPVVAGGSRVGVGAVVPVPVTVSALHSLIMVAGPGPFWIGLHPGRAFRSMDVESLALPQS